MCVLLSISHEGYSQCAVSSTPPGNCNYGQYINTFTLNGVPTVTNNGCNGGGYMSFATPVRSLMLGQTYAWGATVGNFGYPQMGVGIWIDLNNDGNYANNEMVASSPSALSHSGFITIPITAVPGTGRSMRVKAISYTNVQPSDACASNSFYYALETEDYKVDLIQPPNCTGTATTSVLTPTYQICPNATTSIGLATTYTNYGYQYQWQYSSSSAVGPWTVIPGANQPTFATNSMTTSTYFSAQITCTNVSGTVTAVAGQVSVAATHIDNVPYFEDFEGINYNNQLPNCSWLNPNQSNAYTYTNTMTQNRSSCSGNKYAAFYTYFISGSNYMYTNGLNLVAGVTYSASVWYKTDFYSYTNVTNLSLMYGTTQSSTGLTTISSAAPASSGVCKAIGGTFQVPASGVYYLAMMCTSNGNYGTQYVCWDDLSVIIPCSLNSTSITLSTSQTTICSGDQVNLSVSGADTYTWNTGSNASSLSEMPNGNFIYSVVGTNTTTGCTDTQSQMITVNVVPSVVVFADKVTSCAGSIVHLSAYGADTYTWTTFSNNPMITVTPSVTTSYTVVGSNSVGCIGTAAQMINVIPTPTVSASSSAPNQMCQGETQMLTGTGNVVIYEWSATSLFIQSQVALISPMETTTYTLIGTDANGCVGKTTFVQTVDACLGISKYTSANGIKIYPNPSAGLFTVESNSGSSKTVEVTDISGRVVFTATTNDQRVSVNISNMASGIYYVKVQSGSASDVMKVVKQ
jgi:hypothetical protein